MMLRTIYLYELKKLFRARVNMIALTGAVFMLLFLVIFSISEVQPVSREAAKELDGRTIDGELIEEMKPAMRFENGSTLMEITTESEKYVPVMEVITSVAGYNRDLTRFDGSEFYALREQELKQRIEKQGLSETEKEESKNRGSQKQIRNSGAVRRRRFPNLLFIIITVGLQTCSKPFRYLDSLSFSCLLSDCQVSMQEKRQIT